MKSAGVVIAVGKRIDRAARFGRFASLLGPALLFYALFFIVPHIFVLWSSLTPADHLSLSAYT